MFLERIEIEGYKNFSEKIVIEFQKGLNVLVGENGSGKSTIIDAIRLLLLEDEFGRAPISDTDFHRPFDKPNEQANSFRLYGKFSNLSQNESVGFLPWTDLEGNASLTLLVDNKPNFRGLYKRALWGGASRSSMFEWELFDTINCIYLPPLRDAEAKLREGKSSRLARLLKKLNKKSLKEYRDKNEPHPLEKKVQDFNVDLASDPNESIAKTNKLISDRLVEALGTVFGQDTHIQFSEASFSRIVESLRMFFFPDANTSVSRELFRSLEENSLGYNNLLYLATVLAELTEKSDDPEHLKLLLIEEPEAHTHPQLQVRLLKYLEKTSKKENVQVIVTTHSPVLASSISLNSIIHLSVFAQSMPYAVSLVNCGLSKNSAAFINRWLDATKSILLFAKGIILVEGIAEAILLPELAKCVLREYNENLSDGQKKLPTTLEDGGISVINMNGIYFKHFMQLFCNIQSSDGTNIPMRCAGITDNDPPKDSKPTSSNPIIGRNPLLKLIGTINKSDWAHLYVNKLKTFEYDMAMEFGNMNTLIPIAKSLIDTNGDVKNTFEQFERIDWAEEKDETKKAEAAYYLLTHIEKGVFSQKVADHLSSDIGGLLETPEYIRKAVVWACGGESNDI